MRIADAFGQIYQYAWFASFGAAFLFYVVMMRVVGKKWTV
jgi:hypothetical protein